MNDLDSAIDHQLEVLTLASTLPNILQGGLLLNLGNSYRNRFEYSGNVKDIDSAIERHLQAVASIPLDGLSRPDYLASLGRSYQRRFIRFGEMKDIDLAIKQHLEAVNSTPLKSAKPELLIDLEQSYLMRFDHFGEMKDINLANKVLLEAVSSTPLDRPIPPSLSDSLARSYMHRFEHSKDVKDIDLAIKLMLEAVASASPASRVVYIDHLGTIRQCRFKVFKEVKDIDVAIEKYVESLAAKPLDRATTLNNLGDSYLYRYESNQGPGPSDLEESISNFRLTSLCLNGMPSMRISGSLKWARLSHKFNNFVSASEGYDQAISLLPQVAWIGLNAIAQLKELNSDIQKLGCNAAAV